MDWDTVTMPSFTGHLFPNSSFSVQLAAAFVTAAVAYAVHKCVLSNYPAALRKLRPHERTLHALEGFLRRLELTAHRELLVLRGGVLLRHYCPRTPRIASDLDFLALHSNEQQLSIRLVADVCEVPAVNDGVEFDVQAISAMRTWTETEHPGLKVTIPYRLRGETEWSCCSIDLGWGDPLRPPPSAIELTAVLGPPIRVHLAAAAETLFGWKLHGLFEREAIGLSKQGVPKGYWRPKDLFDAYLMAQEGVLTPELLPAAVEIAFTSRGFPLSRLIRLAATNFASGPTSRKNWARWRASTMDHLVQLRQPEDVFPIPAEPAEAVRALAPLVASVLTQLGFAPLENDSLAVPIAPRWKVDRVNQIIAESHSRLVQRTLPSPPQRVPSTTAPEAEAYYVVGGANPLKWEETQKVLAEWAHLILPSDYTPPRELRFPPGLTEGKVAPADAARNLALYAYRELKKPCIVDLVYLELYSVGCFHLLSSKEESAFAKAHAGQAGVMHALICITRDGVSTEVFTGELEGSVVFPVRGEKPYGFNRCWLAEGYGRTLGELRSSFFAVHPRLRPLLELASTLRTEAAYGTLESAKGLFELHITVRTPGETEGGLESFREACGLCGVKAVLIENDGGDVPTQVMTASYVKASLANAHQNAFRLSQRLLGMGFEILRVKVESTLSNRGVPVTDAEAAALSPHNYFEFHWKLRLPQDFDQEALKALVCPHEGRLSRSALRKVANGYQHRFVTLRLYDMGRESALQRMQNLTAALQQAGFDILSVIREYAVYDSNVGLDAGWIDTKLGFSHAHPPSYIDPAPKANPESNTEAKTKAHRSMNPPEVLGTRIRRLLWARVHPLRTIDLASLVRELQLDAKQGYISASASGPADAPTVIYHYRQNVKHWSDSLLLARGAVIQQPQGQPPKVVATPFPKFFDCEMDGITFTEVLERCVSWEATEKLDGSMGILFHHRGEWTLITKRTWDSPQAQWGREWLKSRGIQFDALTVGTTYICEIVYAANFVVVNYEASREGVILCGAVADDGVELSRSELEFTAHQSGLPVVPLEASGEGGYGKRENPNETAQLFDNLLKLREQAASFPGHQKEGLVIRFLFPDGSCHRSKLKSDSYKRCYRLQDGCTEKGIWTAARAGGNELQEMRQMLPPQFSPFFEETLREIFSSTAHVLASAHRAVSLSGSTDSRDGRHLADMLQAAETWPDGSEITQAQRKLAHKALVGRLGSLDTMPNWDLDQAIVQLSKLDHMTRTQAFSFVPVPTIAQNGFITTAEGTRLLNHRR